MFWGITKYFITSNFLQVNRMRRIKNAIYGYWGIDLDFNPMMKLRLEVKEFLK